MDRQWMVETQGDPLGAVQRLVQMVWRQAGLKGMIVSTNGNADALTQPRLIEDPEQLNKVNPFKPVMTANAAQMAPELLRQNPGERFGALLRPCELRALTEMAKHAPFASERLLTISVDCLGTLPADEYRWRVERKKALEDLSANKLPGGDLSQDALQFARQGGILAYRYRSACQVCSSPEAQGADLNINILGLPVRQYILVGARDEEMARRLQLETCTDGQANTAQVKQHERVIARLKERHQRTMERLRQTLADYLPADVDALVDQFADCSACQKCLQICPICSVDYPQRGEDNRYLREDVMRWMISCSGCGMCEQACERQLPLSTIFGHIREQLSKEWGYVPGRSPDEPLPF